MLGLLLAACLGAAAGCAEFDLKKPIPWKSDHDEKAQSTRVVSMWSDAVLSQADRLPTRGFGGRLMFYSPKSEKPIKVNGTLVVYAFDEEGRDPTNTKPDRKYVITPEQLAKHYSKSQLGDSYSVWIPWDDVGGPRQEISLIVRFIPTEGPVVLGEQTKHVLAGRAPTEAEARAKSLSRPADSSSQGVRQVSYETPAPGAAGQKPNEGTRMRVVTTTIPVPPQLGRSWPVAETTPRFTWRQQAAKEPEVVSQSNSGSPEQGTAKPAAAAVARAAATRSRRCPRRHRQRNRRPLHLASLP